MLNNFEATTNFLLAATAVNKETPSIVTPILLMLGIVLVFYIFLIRPQQNRQKELKKQVNLLKKGDFVITSGGIKLEIIQVQEDSLIGKIDKDIKIELQKWAVAIVLKS